MAAKEKSAKSSMKSQDFISRFLPFIVLGALIVVLEIGTGGVLLRPGNLVSLLNGMFAMMIMAMGGVFVYSAGGMDFSIGGILGVCMLEIILIVRGGLTPANLILSGVTAVASAVGIGLLNGIIAVKFQLPAMIATMAMSTACRGIIQVACQQGDISAPQGYAALDILPVKIIVLVAVVVVFFIIFEKTRYGKQLKAIGGNPEAARQSGIRVDRLRIIGFMILGLTCAISALLVAPRATLIRSTTGTGYELDVLIAILLGGIPLTGGPRTRAIGAILGCLIIVILENGLLLMGLTPYMVTLIKAALFIVMAFVNRERSSRKIVM